MTSRPFPSFEDFFAEVHGQDPFPWQSDLARQITEQRWPSAIDVPTGLGKTSVVDIAVYTLAESLATGLGQRPTRTFLIVDRRIIVDSVFEHASTLADAIDGAARPACEAVNAARDGGHRRRSRRRRAAGPACEAVNAALRRRAGEDARRPLEVVRMRGGVTWDWRWLRQPDQPAIVVGTVDQLGSRVLFRGYGVGPRLRPLDAALCGNDAVLILDEAHLAQALTETLGAVGTYEQLATDPVLPERPLQIVQMSATVRADEEAFSIDIPSHLAHKVAAPRLKARKLAHLVDLEWLATPKKDQTGQRKDLTEAIVELTKSRLADDSVKTLAVIVNTVASARAVHQELLNTKGVKVVLLIGRCRQVDRERLLDTWLGRLRADRDRDKDTNRVVVVATQTIEVGADLDFDALITEAAPIDSLVQRFGRVARRGQPELSHSYIVHAGAFHNDSATYGDGIARTWSWLAANEEVQIHTVTKKSQLDQVSSDSEGAADFGPLAMRELLSLVSTPLTAPASRPPVVLGSVLDGWARTEPAPMPDQPVAPFLHGLKRATADVELCWRAGLPKDPGDWGDLLDALPPVSAETVTVPIWEAMRFLAGEALSPDLSDEGSQLSHDHEGVAPQGVRAVAYGGRGDMRVIRNAGDIRPGDLVIVPVGSGGHDGFGWAGSVTGERLPVVDVGDLAARSRRHLRLDRAVLEPLLGTEAVFDWAVLERFNQDRNSEKEKEVVTSEVHSLLSAFLEATARARSPYAGMLAEHLADLRNVGTWSLRKPSMSAASTTGLVVAWPSGASHGEVPHSPMLVAPSMQPSTATDGADAKQPEARSREADDSDEVATSAMGGLVPLDQHLRAVGQRAQDIARRLGLPDSLVQGVRIAGEAHDLGKADFRFQVLLHRGDRLAAEASSQLLAKSGMDSQDRWAHRRALAASGWPPGMRHEAISAALVRRVIDEDLLGQDVDEDLIVHLVAAHHGHGRPLNRPVWDSAPEKVTIAFPLGQRSISVPSNEALVDWDGPARFDALCRKYGRWGLALLEAIVRFADIACSEEGT